MSSVCLVWLNPDNPMQHQKVSEWSSWTCSAGNGLGCPHGTGLGWRPCAITAQTMGRCLSCAGEGELLHRNQQLFLTSIQLLKSGRQSLPVILVHLNFLSAGYLKPGAHVKPGETFTYKWKVPENGGPTESDPPCLTYLYYSATDAVKDTNSGLVGPLLVCRKNTLNHDGTQVPNVNICLPLTEGW